VHEALSGFRHAIAVDLRDVIFDDDATQPDPFAVLAPADERKAPADAVAAWHPHRLACRRGSGAGCHARVRIHRAGDVLIEKCGDVATVAADHGAPPDRTVGYGKRLDHAELRQRIQLRTAPGARHRHTEHAGFPHRRGDRWRDAAALLDLIACCPDLFNEPNRGMQDRRVVCRCLAGDMGPHD